MWLVIWGKQLLFNLVYYRDKILGNLIRYIIYLGVFLLPLFFIPADDTLNEYGKILIFYILTLVAVILWEIKIFISNKIAINTKLLDLPLLFLLVVYLLASLFGLNLSKSILGDHLILSYSLITFCFLFIQYLFISRYII